MLLCAACAPGADPCRVDDDCHENELCVEGACRTVCNSDLDCGRSERCDDGVCWPVPDADATAMTDATTADSVVADHVLTDHALGDAGAADRSARDTLATDLARPDLARADLIGSDQSAALDASQPDLVTGSDTGTPPSGCGTAGTLRDDFNNSQLDWQWVSNSETGASPQENNGRLELSVDRGVPDRFGWVGSDYAMDLRGDAVSVELARAPTAAGIETYLDFDGGQEGWISLSLYNNGLAAIVHQGESNTAFEEVAFDQSAHRFWRISERAGWVHLQASPDRVLWSDLVVAPAPPFVSLGHVALGAGSLEQVNTADFAAFDNLNTDRVAPPWCPAGGFSDTFDQGALSREWELFGPESCTAVQSGGRVTIGNGADCWLYSARVFAFDQVLVEVASAPASEPQAATLLAVFAPSGRWAELGVRGDLLHAWIDSGALLGDLPLLDRRWLRLRRSGASLLFEARDAAGAWQLLHTTAWSAGEGPVFAAIGLDCRNCASTTLTASFDNFNLD